MIPPDATPRQRLWLEVHARAQRDRLAGRWPPMTRLVLVTLGEDETEEPEGP